MPRINPIIPVCVGTYERGHPHCDGDPRADNEAARKPCRWKRRCRGFQVYLNQTGHPPERYVKIVPAPPGSGRSHIARPHKKTIRDFNRWCLIWLPGARDGRSQQGLARRKHYKAIRARMWPTANSILAYIKRRLPMDVIVGKGKIPVLPGCLYLITKYRTLTLKLRKAKGFDVGVLRLKFKLHHRAFDLCLACDVRVFKEQCGPELTRALAPEPYARANFQTLIPDADRAKVEKAVDVLAKLIRDRKLRFEGL